MRVKEVEGETALRMRYVFAADTEVDGPGWFGRWDEELRTMKAWCATEFGPPIRSDHPTSTPVTGGRWRAHRHFVGFWYREDAVLFKLRWC